MEWIRREVNARQDIIVSGSSLSGNALAEWYSRETGVLQGLELVRDWLREFNKKDHEGELS